jgi:hypothetical protein
MTRKPRLIDWILCDDIRLEASGKTTIIGIYGEDVIVPMTPMVLPQLCIITKWDTSVGVFEEIGFRLEMPDGKQMGPVKAKAPHNVKGNRLSMHLAFIPFQIQLIGTYKLHIKIDDDAEKKIGEFEVKLATQK